MTGQIEDIPINGDMIRLGQLLKFSGVSDSGAEAGALIAEGDVSVDGEVETRRGRQLSPGALVDIAEPGGVRRLRVVAG
ncbi:MAG: RNA-binding S4 domain-containing protein [Actinomycetales bacterium]|nr:MAG: RNA-binding S4 domain-containing protein [Actinomycetales bacterium]